MKSQTNKVAGDVLSGCFEASHHAPIGLRTLLDDTGFLGATPAVKEILEGTNVFPPDMDKHTRLLLEGAARTFVKLWRMK